MNKNKDFTLSCPMPINNHETVMLAHGGGGKLMNQLISKMFLTEFSNEYLDKKHDSSVLDLSSSRIAYSTDSYVVHPLFFPGGDIGSMAVYGTVNDLAMSGAIPKYLSLGFIIEEGFSMAELYRIVVSIKNAAKECGVQIVTGDTKVVDKNKGDGIYINTSGIGIIDHDLNITPKNIQPGDCVILSGDIARHGICIMAQREGLEFESSIESDSAPVNDIVAALLKEKIDIHCMRDLTRGGLSSALNELAQECNFQINIDEVKVPVREDVHGACEILGFDPMYVANEGRFIVIVPQAHSDKTLSIMKACKNADEASIIGNVSNLKSDQVILRSQIGVERIMDMLSGQQLPRIC